MFEQLDYVYMPSHDVAADVAYFTETLGARLVFAIDGMGTRVAMVELTEGPPRVLLAGHLHGESPVLVYRVADLERATAELRTRGWTGDHALEIPQGPVRCSWRPAASASASTSGHGPRWRRRSKAGEISRAASVGHREPFHASTARGPRT